MKVWEIGAKGNDQSSVMVEKTSLGKKDWCRLLFI